MIKQLLFETFCNEYFLYKVIVIFQIYNLPCKKTKSFFQILIDDLLVFTGTLEKPNQKNYAPQAIKLCELQQENDKM